GRKPVPLHGLREDSGCGPAGGAEHGNAEHQGAHGAGSGGVMTRIVIEGCAVSTVDSAGTEYAEGHVIVEDGRIIAVGPGSAPPQENARRIDGTGCLLTPGLINTHHHLYQWATRGLAQQETLFGWLTELYPVWSNIDTETLSGAATAALGWMAKS